MVATGTTARAQTAASPVATAGRLLRDPASLASWMALRSSDVAATRSQAVQAQAEARGARLLPNPILDGVLSNLPAGQTNPPGLALDQTSIFGVGLSETFEIGKRGPRAQSADLRARAAVGRVSASLGNRVADARLALGRALYADARQQVLEASLAAARASSEVAKGRLHYQAIAGVDYDRLLLDLAALEADAVRGRAEIEATRSSCAALLRAPCDIAGATVDDLDAALPVKYDLADVQHRADVVSLTLEREAAASDATLAARRAIPDVTARIGYTHDTFLVSGDIANTLSLSMAIPVPLFDRGQHDRAKALAHAAELEQRARGTIQSASGEVAALSSRRRALDQVIATLTDQSIPRARAVLAAEEKGLAEGQVDTTDLLLARRQAIGLELQVLDLRFELFATKNELRRGLGFDETQGLGHGQI